MSIAHVLGFPRIGRKRELKFALESFWRGEIDEAELKVVGQTLRREAAPLMRSIQPGRLHTSRWVAAGRARQTTTWQPRGK